MRDLMIDIETLGNRPGSVILSIGAVAFDAETGEIGEEFYDAIDPSSAAAAGLTTDISTMMWWMKQSQEAQDAAFSGKTAIELALAKLAFYALRVGATRVWAKPPSFDLVLLEAAFRACNLDVPWHFRTHRDCRTIFDLAGISPPSLGTAHNALDDAKSQALGVIAAYAKLGASAPTPANDVRLVANGWVTVRVEDTGDGLIINADDAKAYGLKDDQAYKGMFLDDGRFRIAVSYARAALATAAEGSTDG